MNTELYKYIQQFKKNDFTIISDGKIVKEMVKKPDIKKLRANGTLIVGHDRSKGLTIFFKKPKF